MRAGCIKDAARPAHPLLYTWSTRWRAVQAASWERRRRLAGGRMLGITELLGITGALKATACAHLRGSSKPTLRRPKYGMTVVMPTYKDAKRASVRVVRAQPVVARRERQQSHRALYGTMRCHHNLVHDAPCHAYATHVQRMPGVLRGQVVPTRAPFSVRNERLLYACKRRKLRLLFRITRSAIAFF